MNNILNVYNYITIKVQETINYGSDDLTGGSIDINAVQKGTNQGNILNSNGNLNIIAGGNINSISSQFTTGGAGNINLLGGYKVNDDGTIEKSGTAGAVNLLTAQDYENRHTYHEEYGGLLDMINPMNMDIDISFKGASVSTSYEKTSDENSTRTNTAVVNEINSAGRINIQSVGNITSIGSQIQANGDISLKSDANILLLSASNSQTTDSKHEDTTVTVGVKVGNAYVDAGLAAYAVEQAGEAVKKAIDEVKRMEDLKEEGKASQSAVNDAKANLVMAELNLANATISLAASIAGAASAASSSYGTGIYAAGFANYDTNATSQHTETTWQTQGNIASNGNISFSANNMTQEGTNIYASNGTLSYDITKDLVIKASKDTYFEENKEGHYSGGVSVGNNSVQVSASASESASRTISDTYNNSEVQAANIIINANNATLSGANVNATNQLVANITNNLTIESLQDTYYSNGNSWGVNASIGIGTKGMGNFLGGKESNAGNNSIGAGFNVGSDNTDMAWVNQQTTLTGGSVNITVGNTTTLTGAIVASGIYNENDEFIDNNNLTLSTKKLEYSDIQDINNSESSGFGLSTSVGVNTNKGISLKAQGQTTLTLKNTGTGKEQSTKVTIEAGNITINGTQATDAQLAGLNRDTSNTQEVTRDQITGAFDGSVTMDNRFMASVVSAAINRSMNNLSVVQDVKAAMAALTSLKDTLKDILRDKKKELESNKSTMTKEEYERQLQAFEEAEAAMKADLEKIAKLEEALKELKENENPKDEERDEYVKILKEAQSLGCLDKETIKHLGEVINGLRNVDVNAGQTWCNLYLIGEIAWRGDKIVPIKVINDLSDTFADWSSDGSGRAEKIERTSDGELNHQEASQRATAGEIVVAVQKNPYEKNGHGVFVVEGELTASKQRKGQFVSMTDGLDNSSDKTGIGLKTEPFSFQFGTYKNGQLKDKDTEFYIINTGR